MLLPERPLVMVRFLFHGNRLSLYADIMSPVLDRGKSDMLAVPTLAYSSAGGDRGRKSGANLRSRSRSPVPPTEENA
jgi:hypothetical protein